MPASAATAPPAPTDLARRVAGWLNVYRLLVPTVLLGVLVFTKTPYLPVTHPTLFVVTCAGYFAAALALMIRQRLREGEPLLQPLANSLLDFVAIALILGASGGVTSGLGILLALPVLALTPLADRREALLIAAGATLAVLVPQFFIGLRSAQPAGFATAGMLGVVLFAIALSAWPLADRLRASEATVRRQEVDLANLAQLSQYIVRHLRESILVVDPEDRIRLINDSAARLLGADSARVDAPLETVSADLLKLLGRWRQSTDITGLFPTEDPTFAGPDGSREIRAHFASLGEGNPGPVIVFLEDTSLLAEKVQQSKLAALGRLSASIAHEIRNPVGAMSHAGQLLGESPRLAPEDKRLTEIIGTHAERVSRIIDSVLRLSRREAARAERLELARWSTAFLDEFCETMQWPPEQLSLEVADEPLKVRFDPAQLRQIVWNLCENALRYGVSAESGGVIEMRCGRRSASGRPYLEVADRGPGVPPEHIERIFEPFFSGGRGTGLGLFLARELAQANGATLLYEPRHGGGSIFRLIFADPHRWTGEIDT
jgi:two-component system sensor histidine kinase PilS (NtrC family)